MSRRHGARTTGSAGLATQHHHDHREQGTRSHARPDTERPAAAKHATHATRADHEGQPVLVDRRHGLVAQHTERVIRWLERHMWPTHGSSPAQTGSVGAGSWAVPSQARTCRRRAPGTTHRVGAKKCGVKHDGTNHRHRRTDSRHFTVGVARKRIISRPCFPTGS